MITTGALFLVYGLLSVVVGILFWFGELMFPSVATITNQDIVVMLGQGALWTVLSTFFLCTMLKRKHFEQNPGAYRRQAAESSG